MPMPSWSSIIASSTSDIGSLFNFVLPIVNWAFVPVMAIGVPILMIGLLLYLVNKVRE